MKSLVKRVVLGGLLGVASLFVIEGGTSVWLLARDVRDISRPPIENFRQAAYDSLLGWVGLPNLAIRDNFGPGLTLTTDGSGLRIHRPANAPTVSGERTLLCSGASFTFGSGVPDGDTFCARLEQELPAVRTLNAGQRGYGLDQSYLWYRREGARHPHQLELFAINGTDFERTALSKLNGYPKPVLVVSNGTLVPKNVPVPQWTGWSRWGSTGPVLARLRTMQLLSRRAAASDKARYDRIDAQLQPIVEEIFRDLVKLNGANHSTPLVVYLPTQEEFVPSARDDRRAKLAKWAADAHIAFVDLTLELRQVSPDSLDWMYITANQLPVNGAGGHFTSVGHAWVAHHIAAHLRELPATSAALSLATH